MPRGGHPTRSIHHPRPALSHILLKPGDQTIVIPLLDHSPIQIKVKLPPTPISIHKTADFHLGVIHKTSHPTRSIRDHHRLIKHRVLGSGDRADLIDGVNDIALPIKRRPYLRPIRVGDLPRPALRRIVNPGGVADRVHRLGHPTRSITHNGPPAARSIRRSQHTTRSITLHRNGNTCRIHTPRSHQTTNQPVIMVTRGQTRSIRNRSDTTCGIHLKLRDQPITARDPSRGTPRRRLRHHLRPIRIDHRRNKPIGIKLGFGHTTISSNPHGDLMKLVIGIIHTRPRRGNNPPHIPRHRRPVHRRTHIPQHLIMQPLFWYLPRFLGACPVTALAH